MNWQDCKNILCIRPDNMGDVIMTVPALRALKEAFGARITLLTSTMAEGIVKHIPEIDDVILYDVPWVKAAKNGNPDTFNDVVSVIKEKRFDAAVIFTVYSQNPLPTAMLVYMAGVPRILAYCRENPYQLVTNWVPDQEPYNLIKHQVRRDLDLVAAVGATTINESLSLEVPNFLWPQIARKLQSAGVDIDKPWLLLHAGVSEVKRLFPVNRWASAGKKIVEQGYQVILTGAAAERSLTDELATAIGEGSFSSGGLFSLDEFIGLVRQARLLLSVNTGTIHIAAAVGTPVVVLYAQTNPQHTPWNVPHEILEFPVPANQQSNNEVIKYVNNHIYSTPANFPLTDEIINAVSRLLNQTGSSTQPFPGTPNENREIAAS